MPESSWNLLLQIPLAGIVVVVVVLFLRHLDKTDSRNKEFIKEQAQINRDFLSAQRLQFSDSIARLAEEVKAEKMTTAAGFGELRGILLAQQVDKKNTG